MSVRRLPTGNEFFQQLLVLNSWLSFPALAIIIACLGVLLRLTPDQWRWFFGMIAVYALLATPITAAVQRRMVAPIVTWLDARHEAGESPRRRAFAKLMAMPPHTSLVVALSWLVPVVLISDPGQEMRRISPWYTACGFIRTPSILQPRSNTAFR